MRGAGEHFTPYIRDKTEVIAPKFLVHVYTLNTRGFYDGVTDAGAMTCKTSQSKRLKTFSPYHPSLCAELFIVNRWRQAMGTNRRILGQGACSVDATSGQCSQPVY